MAAIRSARPGPGLEAVLIEALGDPEAAVRTAAVRAMAGQAGTRGVRALIRAATADPWPGVRSEAVIALAAIASRKVRAREQPPGGRPA